MSFHTKYICQQCGFETVGFMGKCPECGNWNTLVETVVEIGKGEKGKSKNSRQSTVSNKPVNLSDIKSKELNRISTKISELDRVVGGGIVPGQVILIAGEPGIGKSTLLLEVASQLGIQTSGQLDNNVQSSSRLDVKVSSGQVLYVCGEESPSQVAIRAKRLGVISNNLQLLENIDVDEVIEQATDYRLLTTEKQNSNQKAVSSKQSLLSAIIVDSIQTMSTSDLSGMAGSVGQVKECTARLVRFAKRSGVPVFIVGHVTKEGTVAGPSVLAHIVDTVLWFEGEKTTNLRILRSIKNRFGPTDEVGIFEMIDSGLKPIDDTQKMFVLDEKSKVAGSAIASVMQGTRPILVEIQALVVETKMAFPKRVAQGIDQKRLEVIIAVLVRRCGIPLYNWDIFVNVSGGIKITEPGSDLSVAMAIASAYFNKPIKNKTVALGEVGLLGEIREVPMQSKRIKEAKRLGYPYTISSSDYKYLSQAIKTIK